MIALASRFLVVLWLLIPVVVIGASMYGWAIGDVWGGLLIGFLPASLLTVVTALVAAIIEGSAARISKRVWVAVAIMALLAAIMFASRSVPDAVKGADTILAYVMLILAFPVALLVPYVLMALASLLSGGGGILGLSGMWFTFFVSGYLQWFVLLPWLRRKWKAS